LHSWLCLLQFPCSIEQHTYLDRGDYILLCLVRADKSQYRIQDAVGRQWKKLAGIPGVVELIDEAKE